ncbi:MAG: protoporphyrinogen oxidase [Planctomycetota bacterium]
MPKRIAVVGGGVAGLATAYEILELARARDEPPEVVCLEAEAAPGGNVRTDLAEGFLLEWGPNGFLDNVPATLELVRRLGISERLLPASPAAEARFIFRGGRLRKLPAGPASFLASDVLSLKGRLRVLCEPFGPGPPRDAAGGEADESVLDFATRRIGREAARVLVAAMVTGVYAGDASRLSLRAAFPKMARMEREFGTLTRALFAKRRAARREGRKAGGPAGPGGRLTSFAAGFEELVRALAAEIGPCLRLRSKATAISRTPGGCYRIEFSISDRSEGPPAEEIEADAVVLACPSWAAAEIARPLDAELGRLLEEIPSAPLAVVHLGFEASEIGGEPRGFGFLVPPGEALRILGTIWASSIFPGRAPPGRVLLTTMVGGARDPKAAGLEDAALLEIVRRDLRAAMGIGAPPRFARIYRHPRGIPQYEIGHPARLEAIERRLAELPGIFVAGNSYRGISVNSCVEEAPRIAREALAALEASR